MNNQPTHTPITPLPYQSKTYLSLPLPLSISLLDASGKKK